MKKIILFLVLALGLLPVVTEQGLTVSAFKMVSQEVDMGLESVVCVSNPWITNSVIEGDYTIDTVCDLVPTAKKQLKPQKAQQTLCFGVLFWAVFCFHNLGKFLIYHNIDNVKHKSLHVCEGF